MSARALDWWGRRSVHSKSFLLAFAIYLTWGVLDGLFTYHGMMTHGISWEMNPRVRRLFEQDPELVLRVKLIDTIRHAATIFFTLELAHYLVPLARIVDIRFLTQLARLTKAGAWGISYGLLFSGLALTGMHVWVVLT